MDRPVNKRTQEGTVLHIFWFWPYFPFDAFQRDSAVFLFSK